MKTIILSFVLLLLVSATAHAQKYLFKMYRFESSELYDTDLQKPKGFRVINGMTFLRVNKKNDIAGVYQLTLASKAKDCMILSSLWMTPEHERMARNMFYGELKAALNLYRNRDMRLKFDGKFWIGETDNQETANKVIEIDSAKYITIIAKDDMKDYFNADTVFIWKTSLPDWYSEQLSKNYDSHIYNECIAVHAIKKGHPSAMIKMLFTTEGKKKEEEYMQILLNSIRYGDILPIVDKEARAKVHKKMKYKFFFCNRKNYFYLRCW